MVSDIQHLLGLSPSAPEIASYITEVADAAKAQDNSKTPEIKSYSDAVYSNYYTLGLSLLFVPKNGYKPRTGLKLHELQLDNLGLDGIDIYNVPKANSSKDDQPKSKSSRSELAFTTYPISPFMIPITAQVEDKEGKPINRPSQVAITPETSGKDFVAALGEPERKGGGAGPSSGSINIWCEWTRDGIMVEFGGAQATGPNAWDTGKDAVWKVITFFKPGTKRE